MFNSDGWYEGATRLPITTGEEGPRNSPIFAEVKHVSDGKDSRNHGQNVANASSFHLLIRHENGKAKTYQFVSILRAAWANGIVSSNNPYMPKWLKAKIDAGINPNRFTVSVEHEREYPYTTAWPEVVIEESIKISRALKAFAPSFNPDREHVIGHYQIDNVNRQFCPGGPGGKLFPFDRIVRELGGAPVPTPSPEPTLSPDLTRFFPETGHSIGGAFYQFWKANGGLRIFGFPLGQEELGQVGSWSGVIQRFQRARFEWHIESGVGEVMLGNIGQS